MVGAHIFEAASDQRDRKYLCRIAKWGKKLCWENGDTRYEEKIVSKDVVNSYLKFGESMHNIRYAFIAYTIVFLKTSNLFILFIYLFYLSTDMDHAKRKFLRILYGPYLQLCGVATKTSRFIMPLNLPPP